MFGCFDRLINSFCSLSAPQAPIGTQRCAPSTNRKAALRPYLHSISGTSCNNNMYIFFVCIFLTCFVARRWRMINCLLSSTLDRYVGCTELIVIGSLSCNSVKLLFYFCLKHLTETINVQCQSQSPSSASR